MHVVVVDPIVHELLELGDCCEPDASQPLGAAYCWLLGLPLES
jgi:hypothetical protein